MMTAPRTKSGPICPFCKGVIAPEIALHGGNCPHCLLEVPGEEEATDPGLALAAKKQAEQAVVVRRRGVRNAIIGVAAFFFLSCAGLVGKYQWDVYQDSLIYELPAYTIADLRNLPEAPSEVPGTPAVAAVDPRLVAKARSTAGSKTPDIGAGIGRVGDVVTGSTAPAGAPGTEAPVGMMAGSGTGGGDVVAPTIGTTGKGVETASGGLGLGLTGREVLSDPDKIKEMVRTVVDGYSRGLDNCYSQALKLNESLRGNWQLTFTVAANGKVAAIDAKALGMSDPDFEACLEARAASWKFSKMVDEFKFKKKFEFAPN